jgi:hypothetical protein
VKSNNLMSHGLQVTIALVVALGVLAALHGQAYGTRVGVPDPVERVVWALVPHGLLIVGLVVLARSRGDLVLLLVVSIVVGLTSDHNYHDELGLVFVFMPLLQLLLVTLALSVVLVRRLWPRLRERFAGSRGTAHS